MARSTRGGRLETREGRLKLKVAKKPQFVRIAPGVGLGYRRNQTAGTWVVRVADGVGSNWTQAIARADDFEEADGRDVLDFWQAQDRARTLARVGKDGGDGDTRPATVAKALESYEGDLKTRGADLANVARVRTHLPEGLAAKRVALLVSHDLKLWRDALAKKLASATVNRTSTCLKAALNLAASDDERIANRQAWEIGLKTLPNAEVPRTTFLTEAEVRTIIGAAYALDPSFGLLVELAAVTGARVSQLARLEVRDVQNDRADPRLMMPASRKGAGQRKITRPVPIPPELASRLARNIEGKKGSERLLLKQSGTPWQKSDHSRLFARAAEAAKLDRNLVTIYALRHTAIQRMILANVPLRIVAAHHDTSVTMIERTYSRDITSHTDTLTRRALLDTVPPSTSNVVSIAAKV